MYFEIKYLRELMCLCGGTSQKHAKTLQSDLTDIKLSVGLLIHCKETSGNALVYKNFSHSIRPNSPVIIHITRECKVCRGT